VVCWRTEPEKEVLPPLNTGNLGVWHGIESLFHLHYQYLRQLCGVWEGVTRVYAAERG